MSQQRTHREELVERKLAVKDVSARQPVVTLEVQWRDDLRGDNPRPQAGRISFEHAEDVCEEAVARGGPIRPQPARRVMDVDRCDVSASRRQAVVEERRDRQLQPWLRRELAVLRVVERALEVLEVRSN